MTTLATEMVVFKVVLTSLCCDVSTITWPWPDTTRKSRLSGLCHVWVGLSEINRCENMHWIKSSAPKLNKFVEKLQWTLTEIAVCSSMSLNVQPHPKYLSNPRSNSSTEEDFLPFHLCPHQRSEAVYPRYLSTSKVPSGVKHDALSHRRKNPNVSWQVYLTLVFGNSSALCRLCELIHCSSYKSDNHLYRY